MALGLLAIFLLFILPKTPPGPTTNLPSLSGKTYPTEYQSPNTNEPNTNNVVKNSSFSNTISIYSGNAPYSYQPADEYITLTNNSDKPITLTGWALQNAKGDRTYVLGGSVQRYVSDSVVIPTGVHILSPTGNNQLENIVLKPSESAVVTTGSIGVVTPYKIVSFKENLCTGYIQNLPDYSFTPPLQSNCVSPRNEPGVRNLDTQCQDYISSMSSCHTPKYDTVDTQGRTADRQGNTCNGCVDGNNTLSNSCISFIKAHFSYQGCLAYHQNDSNFSSRNWRIYLNKQWELWAKSYETISLFDAYEKLVNYQSY